MMGATDFILNNSEQKRGTLSTLLDHKNNNDFSVLYLFNTGKSASVLVILHSAEKIMKEGGGYTLNGMRSKTHIETR